MRIIDKLDKEPADSIGKQLVDDAGLTEQQAGQCLALAEIRGSDTSFVSKVWALGVAHQLLDEGLDELAAVIEGCASIRGVTVEADLRIAPRARLLHRHRVRDAHGRSRVARLGVQRRSLRLAGHRRQDDVPGRGHLTRGHRSADPAAPRRCTGRVALGAVGRARRVAGRRRIASGARRSRRRCARARSPRKSRRPRSSTASRSVTPSGAASRSCGSPVAATTPIRSRTSAAAIRSTSTRRPGCPRSKTCARK